MPGEVRAWREWRPRGREVQGLFRDQHWVNPTPLAVGAEVWSKLRFQRAVLRGFVEGEKSIDGKDEATLEVNHGSQREATWRVVLGCGGDLRGYLPKAGLTFPQPSCSVYPPNPDCFEAPRAPGGGRCLLE